MLLEKYPLLLTVTSRTRGLEHLQYQMCFITPKAEKVIGLRLTDSPWRFSSDLCSNERGMKMLLILSNVYLSNEGIYRIVYGSVSDSSNSNICQYYDYLCTEPREYDRRRSQYDSGCKQASS